MKVPQFIDKSMAAMLCNASTLKFIFCAICDILERKITMAIKKINEKIMRYITSEIDEISEKIRQYNDDIPKIKFAKNASKIGNI